MNLHLTKPLVIFDLETTGVQVATDRIVEIYCIKILPNGEEQHLHQILNPTIPIPEGASLVHGIWDKDVKDKPTFNEFGATLLQFLGNCDFGGFNSNQFDFPLLAEEFARVNIPFDTNRRFVDAQRIYHKMEPRNLAAAYYRYCGKTLENAHSAKADTQATWEIIKSQVSEYAELGKDMDSLNDFCNDSDFFDYARRIKKGEDGEAYFNFGKHKGERVIDVFSKNMGYYDWMMKGDFSQNTKTVITKLVLESKNARA